MIELIGQIVSTTIFLILILLLRAVFYNRISKRVLLKNVIMRWHTSIHTTGMGILCGRCCAACA